MTVKDAIKKVGAKEGLLIMYRMIIPLSYNKPSDKVVLPASTWAKIPTAILFTIIISFIR